MKWPNRETVIGSAETWAKDVADDCPRIRAVACFGSYARGDDGVGSDLDLFVVVGDSAAEPVRRSLAVGLEQLPVPAELIVYTEREWREAANANRRFYRTIVREAHWLWRDPVFQV